MASKNKSDYAYTPSDNVSDYKLNISDANHVKAAVAALGPSGFRGNKVQIPAKDLPAVKRKVAAAYKKFFPDNELPPVLKSLKKIDKALDVKVNDQAIEDPGLLGTIISSMASYFRDKEWRNEWVEDNSEFVEEQMFGTYEECPACGCDMTEGDPVCPQCGCDTSKIDSEYNSAEMQQKSVSGYFIEKSANEELRQGTFIVLEPETVDLHGDIYSAEDIAEACHNFNTFCRKAYVDHTEETQDAVFVESYVAPVDMEIGKQQVKKGTWLSVVQFSEELWPDVKSGKYTGLSIGAYAAVEEV